MVNQEFIVLIVFAGEFFNFFCFPCDFFTFPKFCLYCSKSLDCKKMNIIILILSFNSCKSGQPRLALVSCGPFSFAYFFLAGFWNEH